MMPELKCPKCQKLLAPESIPGDGAVTCPWCRGKIHIHIFPAFFRDFEKGQLPEKIVVDSEAVCFFHLEKSAVTSCSKCGVFLCKLCELDIGGKLLCPKCFEAGKKEIATFTKEAFLYDELFYFLSLIGLLTCYFSWLILPISFIGSIYCWKKIKTPYARRKWRFVAAMIISVLGLGLIGFLIVATVSGLIK